MTAIIEQFGALGVFLLMVPESACIPVPSEVTLMFSGFAVSQHWMSLLLAIVAATAGNVVGSLIAYAIGATHLLEGIPGGRPLLARSERLLDGRGMRAVLWPGCSPWRGRSCRCPPAPGGCRSPRSPH